ncbi:MAG: AmmeMemoRadiSam system radical SAM enzyme [Syntrophomonadaceae bacterium]|nr:AmmeMemoRadiSam system radical SAM enzyme [Syntrophomonadaceae bacterium]
MEVSVKTYKQLENGPVRCGLCPHNCRIQEGKSGVCRVRINRGGKLFATNYGEVSSMGLDPIEKKPLYHFYPGHSILSVGTVGCSLSCSFCQNYQIAQENPPTRFVAPEELLNLAQEAKKHDSVGVAYTYSEPLMWYEYLADVLPMMKNVGLENVLVTNGYINPEPLQAIISGVDAMNIDLKSFAEQYYRSQCRGRLSPVKETIEYCVRHTHVELTCLLIPGLNDSREEIEAMCRWIAGINASIPLHLSAYHPAYKLKLPPTPRNTMEMAWQIANRHLQNVYVGNMAGFANNSCCSNCQAILVAREGYMVKIENLAGTRCRVCGKDAYFTCQAI